jgi:hypothetical protein
VKIRISRRCALRESPGTATIEDPMRRSHASVLLFVLLVAAGCEIHAGTQANAPQQQPQYHPGYVYYSQGQPPPPPPRMAPAQSVPVQVDIGHLQAAAAQPRRCDKPHEVAPGVFTHLDCQPYRRIAIAQKHANALKMNLMRSGRLKWRPFTAASAHGINGTASGANEAAPLPDMVDHRLSNTEGPIKDQGDVGACTAFALSSVMDNSLRRGQQNITTSPEHLWAHYGTPTMEDAASGNLNKPITTYEAMPYSGKEACEIMRDPSDDCGSAYHVASGSAANDAALQSKIRAADGANGHRVVTFEELDINPVNIDELVSTLASGADLWVAFHIDGDAWSNRKMQNYVIPDWSIPEGGHALAMSGYRKVNGGYQFLIHNSWGVSWGDQGYAWVSQAMVQKWLHLAYKVRTDVDNVTPPKTDEDCPGDQVLDQVTNRCVGICPDQSRPSNGQCPNGPAPPPQPLPLPGLQNVIPGFPGVPGLPGWPPAPQPQPAPGGQPAPAPSQQPAPAWPWPMPSSIPQLWPPPSH